MKDFVGLLRKLLVSSEYGKSPEEVDRLLKKHTNVVIQGIMSGELYATAMALEMAQDGSRRDEEMLDHRKWKK
ncbi:hypothetical protein LCGC14_1625490 [marine sediment metagenome]|uniref:Uncharacterized protein n=1 Tax=marine sediment metagenome TaxID=412755 RepID=A0A0F9I4F2_9ZZZZ